MVSPTDRPFSAVVARAESELRMLERCALRSANALQRRVVVEICRVKRRQCRSLRRLAGEKQMEEATARAHVRTPTVTPYVHAHDPAAVYAAARAEAEAELGRVRRARDREQHSRRRMVWDAVAEAGERYVRTVSRAYVAAVMAAADANEHERRRACCGV